MLHTFSCGGGGGLVVKSCLTLVTPWTIDHQALLSMGFGEAYMCVCVCVCVCCAMLSCSRQEYWSGLPCPSPGDLPNPGLLL